METIVFAIKHAFSFTCKFPSNSQADSHGSTLLPFSLGYLHAMASLISLGLLYLTLDFVGLIMHLIDSGLCGANYASHSFRQGGASFAFQARVPIKLIKILGDWKSNAVMLFLTVSLTVRIQSINITIANQITHMANNSTFTITHQSPLWV